MLIYEVNLEIKAEIYSNFKDWLPEHINAVLATPEFVKAETYKDITQQDAPNSANIKLTVAYQVASSSALDTYLADFAPRLRQDGIDKFGDKFKASRRILEQIDTYNG